MTMQYTETPIPQPAPGSERTRRAMLAGALGGLGAIVASALGRAAPARGASGDPLIIGQNNFAGSSATRLFATSSGGAFWMTQNGSGSGVRGESINGSGGVFETRHADRYGLVAQNNAAAGGIGAALKVDGNLQTAMVVSSAEGVGIQIFASTAAGLQSIAPTATAVQGSSASGAGIVGSSETGVAVQGLSTGGLAGNFIGPMGVSSYVRMMETADPGAADADTLQLFARDNGSGKTQLCVRFPTGSLQVLATEP